MKRTFYLFALIGFAVLSCKKDGKSPSTPDPDNNSKTYEVSFNIGIDAENGLVGIKSKSGKKINANIDLSNVATFLGYYVYNSQNVLISHIVQDSTSANFGKIADKFANGTYTIIVFATKNKPDEYNNDVLKAFGKETFYKKSTITVSNSSATQNINLERVSAQLQVKITDAIPQGTASIYYGVNYDYPLLLSTGLPDVSLLYEYPRLYKKVITSSVVGTTNYTFSTFVTNTVNPITVKLTVYNTGSNVPVKTITINDVIMKPNTRTILSGKVFGDQNSDFNITFKEWYDSDTTRVDF